MKPTLRFHGASGVRFAAGVLLLLLAVLLEPAQAQPTKDFGDAPSPYPTLLNDNGARHTVTGPLLGALRDAETDGLPQVAAFGDDNSNTDDEDGVVFLNPLVPWSNKHHPYHYLWCHTTARATQRVDRFRHQWKLE
jgi:hypothetical protein